MLNKMYRLLRFTQIREWIVMGAAIEEEVLEYNFYFKTTLEVSMLVGEGCYYVEVY